MKTKILIGIGLLLILGPGVPIMYEYVRDANGIAPGWAFPATCLSMVCGMFCLYAGIWKAFK